MLGLLVVSMKWWFKKIWVHMSVFIWYSNRTVHNSGWQGSH